MTARSSPSPEAERAGAQSPAGDGRPAGGMTPVTVPEPAAEATTAPGAEAGEPPSAEALASEMLASEMLASEMPASEMPASGGPAGEAPLSAAPAGEAPEEPEDAEARAPGQPGQEPASEPGTAGEQPADGGNADPEDPVAQVPPRRARVDARLLEATLLNLRKRVAAIPLVFEVPGAEEVSAERANLLSQIDDYLLPRVRQSAAPVLVALVGSTGAGKSTLVNSIVGTQVSLTGVRRPTTNSPVLACHPDDIHWFAENMFLPTLPRVRQEGLARPGRDGLLVLAASEKMARGFALLDTPDIDSVAHSHREFAYQFLDASDLWLFMTSSSRYADAPVWEILQHARERGAALGVVLSRVPHSHRTELVTHFNAMLDANGIMPGNRFVIPESGIIDNMLPEEVFQPIKDWLTETAQREDRRVAVLTQTMAGVLDTFKTRIPRLAGHVDTQVTLRLGLRQLAETGYAEALSVFDARARDATLLRGEVLARWQDYAASGDLDAALRSRRQSRKGRRARKGSGGTRAGALDAALRTALEALVVSVADTAAERVSRAWRGEHAGAALLARAEASRAKDEQAEREFASAFGLQPPAFDAESTAWAASVAADFRDEARDPWPGEGAQPAPDDAGRRANTLGRSSPGLPARAARAISAWQDHLIRAIRGDGADPPARGRVDTDGEPLALLGMLAVLGERAPGIDTLAKAGASASGSASGDEIGNVPRDVLIQALGLARAADLLDAARKDLAERVRLLLDEEMVRFFSVLDEAGPIDPVAAVRLYQAEYSLEAAR